MPSNEDTITFARRRPRRRIDEPGGRSALLVENTCHYVAEPAVPSAVDTSMQQQATLLAQLAHDLKNPLSVIIASTHMLRQHIPEAWAEYDERFVQGLAQIDAAAARIVDYLDRALESARLRAGSREQRQIRLNLTALVSRVVDAAQQTTSQHALHLVVAAPDLIGYWDVVLLELLFENLLANAIKYSPHGGDVTVTLMRDVVANTQVAVVTIQDHGIGIPSTDLPYIFERFQRGHNVGQIAGTGLGLASARQIVMQHGGSLAIESEAGVGTTAIVHLPLTPEPSRGTSNS